MPIAAAPIAATPAARAAFLAARPTFGRRAFFAVPDRFALVVFFFVPDLFARVVFLVFDLVLARFNEDLALVPLTLLFMNFLPLVALPAGNSLGAESRAGSKTFSS